MSNTQDMQIFCSTHGAQYLCIFVLLMTRILHLYGICLHKFEGVESIQQNCTVSIQISLGEYLVLKTLRLENYSKFTIMTSRF